MVLPTNDMTSDETLKRAHLVLAFLLHFFVQTIPPTLEVLIPPSIGIPVLRVSALLDIPPVLTYSDTVLYNWVREDKLHSQTMFTGLGDEEEFYLSSARVELAGAKALSIMCSIAGDLSIAEKNDSSTAASIAGKLREMVPILYDVKNVFVALKDDCDPEVYYHVVRPWLKGEDSSPTARKWHFEGLGSPDYPDVSEPSELSGPSAGQSSFIHALDIFLGVVHNEGFLARMRVYMPKEHRAFLDWLSRTSLRSYVLQSGNENLSHAYNDAIMALKEIRDAHMAIATSHILSPSKKGVSQKGLKGTGGTDFMIFLKQVRNRTREAAIAA
jgi:indoleamine 2,3-dioxygenase